jgi:A/G-specific adenine glycosylase
VRPDFYRIWLSEIMLQQTRVEAVIPYYHRFLARFPTIDTLAAAPESDVLALWSGLGYYSRARRLHGAARQIAAGRMPADYAEVRDLPGVGAYTAAAVASIALGLAHAAVDGNVIRVLSRLYNDASEITSPAARRRFSDLAADLLDARRPGDFNQAMMELGATVCLPRTPACAACPVARFCAARAAGTARALPVKLKKQQPRDVALDLAVLEHNGCVFLLQRNAAERRLADFWELPPKQLFPKLHRRLKKTTEFRHQIVNDRFRVTIWHGNVGGFGTAEPPRGRWLPIADLGRFPLTTVARKALASLGSNRLS